MANFKTIINKPTVIATLIIETEDTYPISHNGYCNLVAMFIEEECPQLKGQFDRSNFGHMGGIFTVELGNETYYVEEEVGKKVTISARDNTFTWFPVGKK